MEIFVLIISAHELMYYLFDIEEQDRLIERERERARETERQRHREHRALIGFTDTKQRRTTS